MSAIKDHHQATGMAIASRWLPEGWAMTHSLAEEIARELSNAEFSGLSAALGIIGAVPSEVETASPSYFKAAILSAMEDQNGPL